MKSSPSFASFAILAGMFSVAGLTGARATTVNCAAGQTIGAAIGSLHMVADNGLAAPRRPRARSGA